MSDDLFTWREGHALVNQVGKERWLADRIRTERKNRGWSQTRLVKEMMDAGHPIQQSAVSKIESPPRDKGQRAITIDEAIGFSKVFHIPLGELLLPRDAARDAVLWGKYLHAVEIRIQIQRLTIEYENLVRYSLSAGSLPSGFRTRLAEHRAAAEAEEDGRRRDLALDDSYPKYLEIYERPAELAVVDDILGEAQTGPTGAEA